MARQGKKVKGPTLLVGAFSPLAIAASDLYLPRKTFQCWGGSIRLCRLRRLR